jgi:maleate isomerase
MPDVVGHRAKVGVVVPSTNTVVEHDVHAVGPRGVTFHTGRMHVAEPSLDSDAAFEALLDQIRAAISTAIRDVLTCEPDHLLMGMSAETFWGGVEGNRRFTERVAAQSGLPVTTGATACRTALEALGVRRIAVLTPYQPVADEQVRGYFVEAGFDVVRARGLRCPTATSIAQVPPDELVRVLTELDGPDVDAIVQCGTNLSMLRLADEAEHWLRKPVIAINAATLWHALRSMGFGDRFDGHGTLLREL